MAMKEPTFRFFIKDKEGNPVNIDTLTEEERREVGVWAYRTLLEGLGYEPVDPNKVKAQESQEETAIAERRRPRGR